MRGLHPSEVRGLVEDGRLDAVEVRVAESTRRVDESDDRLRPALQPLFRTTE